MSELKEYYRLLLKASQKRAEIDLIDARMRSIKSGGADAPVMGGCSGNRLDALIDSKMELFAEAEIYESKCKVIRSKVAQLTPREQQVVHRFFMEGLTTMQAVNELLEDFGTIDERTIFRYRKQALEHYDNIQ